ncbi:MAG TPA: DUF5916 domain-containing protein [Pyrinomonadaceae bacterium]|jgi:hypothetical protein
MKTLFLSIGLVFLISLDGRAHSAPRPLPSPTAEITEDAKSSPRREARLPPEKALPIRLSRFEKPPVIDGRLDEADWQRAAILKDFYQTQPGDNVTPSQPTELLIGYDARFLYVAFRAHDEPGKVRATVAKRDSVLEDDNVRIILDTFNDQRRAYVMVFNPLGVQQDGIMTEERGEDFSVDLVMESKGMVVDDGYVVEVAIPFKSLRYEAGRDRLWGIHAIRRIKHLDNEQDSWMPIMRSVSGFLSQEGHLTGLENISTERTLELVPSLTLSETGKRLRTVPAAMIDANPALTDPGRMLNGPIKFEPGLTAKFGLTPTITLDLAINPDFAQVEADAAVVTANQRFPIFFEEKRSFFLEGIDIFQTSMNAVNTRAIVDPDIAVKLSGKRGRNSFGIMLASDNAPGNFSREELDDPTFFRDNEKFIDKNAYIGVLRLKRDIGRENNLGLIATSYNFIEKHNQLGGFDGRFRLNPQSVFSFQVLGTTSRRLFYDADTDKNIYRTGNGFGYLVNLERKTRRLYMNAASFGRTQDYRADVGFTRRTGTNVGELFIRYSTEPDGKRSLQSWNVGSYSYSVYDWRARMRGWGSGARAFLNFRRQTFVGFGFDGWYERLFEEEFGPRRNFTQAGAFYGDDPERSSYTKSIFFAAGSVPSKKYSGEIYINYNIGGLDFDFGAGPKFPRASRAALTDTDAKLDPGAGNGWDITAKLAYQPTDALRLTLNYNKSRLVRYDTGRVAFDADIYSLRSTYQFTRFTFARARLDYSSVSANVRAQFLLGWTPNPGTAFFVGYNDDMNRNGYSPFTGDLEPGLRRNGRTFFIKMSYLFRRSF